MVEKRSVTFQIFQISTIYGQTVRQTTVILQNHIKSYHMTINLRKDNSWYLLSRKFQLKILSWRVDLYQPLYYYFQEPSLFLFSYTCVSMVENKLHLHQCLNNFVTLTLFDHLHLIDRRSFTFPYLISFAFWNLNIYFETLHLLVLKMPPKS